MTFKCIDPSHQQCNPFRSDDLAAKTAAEAAAVDARVAARARRKERREKWREREEGLKGWLTRDTFGDYYNKRINIVWTFVVVIIAAVWIGQRVYYGIAVDDLHGRTIEKIQATRCRAACAKAAKRVPVYFWMPASPSTPPLPIPVLPPSRPVLATRVIERADNAVPPLLTCGCFSATSQWLAFAADPKVEL